MSVQYQNRHLSHAPRTLAELRKMLEKVDSCIEMSSGHTLELSTKKTDVNFSAGNFGHRVQAYWTGKPRDNATNHEGIHRRSSFNIPKCSKNEWNSLSEERSEFAPSDKVPWYYPSKNWTEEASTAQIHQGITHSHELGQFGTI